MLNFIAILFFIEVGMSEEVLRFNQPLSPESTVSYFAIDDTYYVDLGVEATLWKHLFIKGSTETQMVKSSRELFAPYQIKYYIDIGLKYDWLFVGYKHACFHAVTSKSLYTSRDFVPELYGGFTKLYVRAEFKIK